MILVHLPQLRTKNNHESNVSNNESVNFCLIVNLLNHKQRWYLLNNKQRTMMNQTFQTMKTLNFFESEQIMKIRS